MDFLTLMQTLLRLNDQFRGMTWDTEENDYSESTIILRLPVDRANVELLADAKAMFDRR